MNAPRPTVDEPFERGKEKENRNQRRGCGRAEHGTEIERDRPVLRGGRLLEIVEQIRRTDEMRVGQPRLSRERLEIGLTHRRKMLFADRERGSEWRVASVVSLSLVGAGRRKTKAIVVRNVLDAVETDFAALVIEFRDWRELVAASADDQSADFAAASFERRRT